MAGDWIKMRTDLYRHPKVCLMADCLMKDERYVTVFRNVTRNAVVGALCSVWGVMRHRGHRIDDDLVVTDCSLSVVDDIADLHGFATAMEAVGWVADSENLLVFPRFFAEMNSPPKAVTNAERQRRYREKKRNASNALRSVTLRATVTGEKSREEREKSTRKENLRESQKDLVFAFPDILNTPAFQKIWLDWVRYRQEIRKPLTQLAADKQIKRLGRMGAARAAAAIDFTIAQQYQGIVEQPMREAATTGRQQELLTGDDYR